MYVSILTTNKVCCQHTEFPSNSSCLLCCWLAAQHDCGCFVCQCHELWSISMYTHKHSPFPPHSPVNVSSWSHSVTWVRIRPLMSTVSLTLNTQSISTVLEGLWLSLLNTRVSCLCPRVKPLPWGVVRSQPPWLTQDGPLYCWTVGIVWAHPKWRERKAEATFHTRAKGAILSPRTIPTNRRMWEQ